jgi:hypothetical protein
MSPGREAEPLARLDGGTRQDDPLDDAAFQQHGCMRHGEEGLARARRADAEDEFGTVERADIGILVRRAGEDRLLSCRNLRHGKLRRLADRRQRELIVGGHGHAQRAVDIGGVGLVAARRQPVVEIVERAARLLGRGRFAADRDLVALGANIDTEALLDQREVLVELPVERAGMVIVVEAQNDMRQIGGAGCGIHLGFCVQAVCSTSLLSAIRLFAETLLIRTSTMSPIFPTFSSQTTG